MDLLNGSDTVSCAGFHVSRLSDSPVVTDRKGIPNSFISPITLG